MKILAVLAHPDDEVIFGWPIIQQLKGNDIYLITAGHNRNKYPKAEEALKQVCLVNDIFLVQGNRAETNFYRLPPRYADFTLPMFNDATTSMIAMALSQFQPDYIFTHNPMGEYGHGDHKLLFNLVASFDYPVLTTDICFYNKCHNSYNSMPRIYRDYMYEPARKKTTPIHCVLDIDWYERMKMIYEQHNSWSWGGHEPIRECNLYKFE